MIGVGIHENLQIHKTTKNDQGTLVLGVKQAVVIDPTAALNGSGTSTSFEAPEQDFLIYPPKVTNLNGEQESMDAILKKIAELKDPLNMILQQFTTADKIRWDIFAGTGVTMENLGEKITNQTVLDKVYANIVDQFISQMSPFMNSPKRFRMIFVRQSQAKHYAKLRTRFLDSQPFIESMEIPASASKLKFTPYEITKGLNNPNPVGGAQTVSTQDAAAASSVFG